MEIRTVAWIRSQSPDTDAVLAYSARELARYGRALTEKPWDARPAGRVGSEPGTVWLGLCDRMPGRAGATLTPAQWDDGFAIWHDGSSAFVSGRNGRSVLFGVYALLERQGVRFLRPGRDGEVIPSIPGFSLPDTPLVQEPRYRHRGVCIERVLSVEHARDMVDWCAKKRMNSIFLQFFSSRFFYSMWYERQYNPQYADHTVTEQEALDMDEQVIAAIKQRGLVFHRVGHSWTSAAFGMPRSGWVAADQPVQPKYARWLAEVDGERKPFGGIPINTELCYSHQPAFDAFVENIVRYCEAHPELDVVHVWLSDATNNKCECAACRELSISDWYAKIISALSENLHRRVPRMRFVFLCYIELLWPPERVAIDERYGNAIMMFAPIARCYGHGIADPACTDGKEWPRPPLNEFAVSDRNAFYARVLADWRQVFRGDSFDFDYHLMWANWRQLTDTHVARLYHEDLQHLKDMGLDGLISCQSFRVFYPSGLAMTALAESLWNPDTPWEEMRQEYLEAAFGEQASFAGEYLRQVESFLDTGDPHWRTAPLSNASPDKLEACSAFLQGSLDGIAVRKRQIADRARRRSLDLLAHHARLLLFLVEAYQARHEDDAERAARELDHAAAFLRRTEVKYSSCIDTYWALRSVERAGAQM